MPAITLENVEKIYQLGETEVKALRGSDAEIEEGEFVAIMGPSGSGKSTLMNMIGALDIPTTGEVNVGGEQIGGMTEDELALLRSRKIGFVFQEFNLINSMNAWQNVALPMVFRGKSKAERKERAIKLLEDVGLGDRTEHRPSELSGGQRQRVSIARSLANDPDILLADEPTGNLDTETGGKIMDLLTDLNDRGKTIIMVTHDPNDAEYADRTIQIVDGVTDPKKETNQEELEN
ncbi:ABC transporter ATP-binding protein [Candidatus Nanohalobium constans]|uniref:ABC transport system ATP-binding protein n=1 Tax=Candidatus Nanohalobium constans TaxID=2565781 RepID=A0A5Q0UEI2_9ARCH|nr:ABC transporter ATP-binding protein [Candidatus Nanohalobium constans]QGA79937.1 ABC transport system ATP-binding protein [Candidatus Nanohalobium constans]